MGGGAVVLEHEWRQSVIQEGTRIEASTELSHTITSSNIVKKSGSTFRNLMTAAVHGQRHVFMDALFGWNAMLVERALQTMLRLNGI